MGTHKLNHMVAIERSRELREAAEAFGRVHSGRRSTAGAVATAMGRLAGRRRRKVPTAAALPAVTIRRASATDAGELRKLADLETAPAPSGEVLIAEVNGRLRAALPLAGGPAIADPFEPTAAIVSLLAFHAAQLGPVGRSGSGHVTGGRRIATATAVPQR